MLFWTRYAIGPLGGVVKCETPIVKLTFEVAYGVTEPEPDTVVVSVAPPPPETVVVTVAPPPADTVVVTLFVTVFDPVVVPANYPHAAATMRTTATTRPKPTVLTAALFFERMSNGNFS